MTARRLGLGGVGLLLVLQGCSTASGPEVAGGAPAVPARSSPSAIVSSVPAPVAVIVEADEVEPPGPATSDGRPRRAVVTIPSIDSRVAVVPYQGWTDDSPGTAIQDGGLAASPYGPRGGVGPGGIGNYQVTAHRTSSAQAFEFLPDVRIGERIFVDVRTERVTTRYVYRVVRTRQTSFRSPASLRAQRAAVPGRPGVEATRAMITLSTCATREDHAAGNYWSDEFHNPEHRIDKVGLLVSVDTL